MEIGIVFSQSYNFNFIYFANLCEKHLGYFILNQCVLNNNYAVNKNTYKAKAASDCFLINAGSRIYNDGILHINETFKNKYIYI